MGRKLWSLGLDKGTTGDGASAVAWNEEKFMRIFSSYGLGKTSEIPEMSESPENHSSDSPDISDHSDVTDVLPGEREGENNHHFLHKVFDGQEIEL